MTTEPAKILQNNLSDLASLNCYGVVTLTNGQRVNVQMTMRHGMDADKMMADFLTYVEFLNRLEGVEFWDGNKPKTEAPKAEDKPTPSEKHEGTYDDPEQFSASAVTVEYKDGKEYFRVKGVEGKFPKFPVTVWPEVLDKAGIDKTAIDPKNGLPILGWTAKYIKNDKGNPGKVIELVKPEFA